MGIESTPRSPLSKGKPRLECPSPSSFEDFTIILSGLQGLQLSLPPQWDSVPLCRTAPITAAPYPTPTTAASAAGLIRPSFLLTTALFVSNCRWN